MSATHQLDSEGRTLCGASPHDDGGNVTSDPSLVSCHDGCKPLRGLRADVLTGKCTSANGGISEHVERVTMVGPEFPEVFAATDDAPAVRLVRRGSTVHFEPVEEKPDGHVGYMASGAHVESSDSRFIEVVGFYGAVALHDRTESQAHYDALSI
jgi:hypothetical protein